MASLTGHAPARLAPRYVRLSDNIADRTRTPSLWVTKADGEAARAALHANPGAAERAAADVVAVAPGAGRGDGDHSPQDNGRLTYHISASGAAVLQNVPL
jgi:hypothetical protein